SSPLGAVLAASASHYSYPHHTLRAVTALGYVSSRRIIFSRHIILQEEPVLIGIIGATGNIGQCLVGEALARGHRVNAFTRDTARANATHENLSWAALDVFDSDAVAAQLPGLDVLISCYQPGNAAADFEDTVEKSIADPTVYATVARTLLKALET